MAGAGCSAGQCATALGFLQSSVKISPGVPSPSSRAQHGLRRPGRRCLGRLQVGRGGLASGPSPAVSPPPSTPPSPPSLTSDLCTQPPPAQPRYVLTLHSDLHTLHTPHQLKTVFTNFVSVESFKNISGVALTSLGVNIKFNKKRLCSEKFHENCLLEDSGLESSGMFPRFPLHIPRAVENMFLLRTAC